MTKPDDSSVQFKCPRCFALLRALKVQAGTKQRCPRCQFVLKVPSETPAQRPGEEYPVAESAEPSPASRKSYVGASCPVCGTRVHAAEDQLDRQVPCPDCDTPVTISRPAGPKVEKSRPAVPVEEYPLAEEVDEASDGPRAMDLTYIRVTCLVCSTMMYATEDEIGGEIVCPDCDSRTVVPPPPAPKRRADPMEGAGEGYAVADATELPGYEPLVTVGRRHPPAGIEQPVDGPERPAMARPQPHPSRRPFLSGVLGFPLYCGVWQRWLTLSVGAAIVLLLAEGAFLMITSVVPDRAAIGIWIVSMLLISTATLLGMMWIVVASAVLLAVIHGTAAGSDQIEDWPDGMFLDWAPDSFYLVNSLLLSALPGLGIAWALRSAGMEDRFAVPASLLIVFPVVLLSMLEANSSVKPLSWPVWRSMWGACRAWGIFYIESTLVVVAAAWIALEVAARQPLPGIPIVAALSVAVLLIYFRLLGRLAWCCAEAADRAAERTSKAESHDHQEEQEEAGG